MRRKLVLWSVLSIAGFPIGHPAVCQTAAGTTGIVCLNKATRILSVQRTIVAISRHCHDEVSGGSPKELRKDRGTLWHENGR